MTDCICGHARAYHDDNRGCIKFLCCHRTRNLGIGRGGSEHDFINHTIQGCPCAKFEAEPDRWTEDTEAGAIG